MGYPKELRDAVIVKLLSPNSPGPTKVADEFGISFKTVYRWRNMYQQGSNMEDTLKKRPQDWSAEEKFQALMDTANLNEEEMGDYCRRNGLHSDVLQIWRETCLTSIRKGPRVNPIEKKLKVENKELKRDLRRKEKALAETTALLVLKKKAALIWGTDVEDEDDS